VIKPQYYSKLYLNNSLLYDGLKRSNILIGILSHAHMRSDLSIVIYENFTVSLTTSVSTGQIFSRIGYFTFSQIVLLTNAIIWVWNVVFYWKGAAQSQCRFGTTVFVECFPVAGEKALSYTYSILYCQSLPLSYIVDERRLLFWRKMLLL